MESINISFSANRQTLTGGGLYCASNTVHYIIADFELGDGWDGFDSVRAVWSNDFKCISTVLDPDGSCTVPHEVLERRGKVSVNLVGSILEDDELTDRLTTYPILAITVDANAKVCGTETAEVTPSQFEQYVAIVIAEVEKVTGMTAVAQALPEGSEPTANYSDGVLTLGIPKGDTGATGNGISSIEFNEDYSLTFYFTDSEPFTTPSIRGEQGARGYGIASVEKIDSTGLVDTYRINFEDPSVPPTTFTVTNGEEGPQGPRGYTGETGNGIDRIELTDTTGAVKTYTIYFTDGSTYDFEVTDGEVTLAELVSVLPTDTASGAIASFEDGSDLFDYLSCIVSIEPVQDLHGYDKPWVGGSGKNKLQQSWSSPLTHNGVTFTRNSDGSVTATGGTNATQDAYCFAQFSLPVGNYYFTGCASGGSVESSNSWNVYMWNGTTNARLKQWNGTTNAATNVNTTTLLQVQVPNTTDSIYYVMRVMRGTTLPTGGITFYPMICLSTETSPIYLPWENLCPITGWTGCEVDVSGVNLLASNGLVANTYISNVNGNEVAYNGWSASGFMPASPNVRYRFMRLNNGAYEAITGTNAYFAFYDENKQFVIGGVGDNLISTSNLVKWVRVSASNANMNKAMFVADDSASQFATESDYVDATIYPVSWQTEAGTVYGGTVDLVTGVLTVDRAVVTFNNGSGWSVSVASGHYRAYNYSLTSIVPWNDNSHATTTMLCDKLANGSWDDVFSGVGVLGQTGKTIGFGLDPFGITDNTGLNTWLSNNPFQIVYELATPITYQLDPVQVACLLGHNNVWADCGNIEEIKYKADVQLWVEKKLGE